MRVQGIRFSEEDWQLVTEMAARIGVTPGAFARSSTVAHAIAIAVEEGGPSAVRVWMETLTTLREVGEDTLTLAAEDLVRENRAWRGQERRTGGRRADDVAEGNGDGDVA